MNYLMVCKIIFCSEFPDIPDKAGRNKKNTGNCKAFCVLRKSKNKTKLQKKNNNNTLLYAAAFKIPLPTFKSASARENFLKNCVWQRVRK